MPVDIDMVKTHKLEGTMFQKIKPLKYIFLNSNSSGQCGPVGWTVNPVHRKVAGSIPSRARA